MRRAGFAIALVFVLSCFDGVPAGADVDANLEAARSEALAFAEARGFPSDQIEQISGPPWRVNALTLPNGHSATEYQWLGPGKGGYFVHVTVDEVTGDATVVGGFSPD